MTFRSMKKNRLYAFLNIFGLAIGIASAIYVYQYVSFESSFDNFHNQSDNIYRLQYQTYQEGKLQVNSATAVPRIGPFMKENFPEVLDFGRAYPLFGIMQSDEEEFREDRVLVADPGLLRIFNFSLLHGNPDHLLDEPN